ncbi:MAG: STAS domain-containing protein [Candidatus Peribacteraceae bacterium]|jgi:anti-sigma B factor antagonist
MTQERKHISVEVRGNVAVVTLLDRNILNPTSIKELGQECMALVAPSDDGTPPLLQENTHVILQWKEVNFASSAVLNKCILLERAVKKRKGRLRMCSLPPNIREVFFTTRLDQLFSIVETEADAFASL